MRCTLIFCVLMKLTYALNAVAAEEKKGIPAKSEEDPLRALLLDTPALRGFSGDLLGLVEGYTREPIVKASIDNWWPKLYIYKNEVYISYSLGSRDYINAKISELGGISSVPREIAGLAPFQSILSEKSGEPFRYSYETGPRWDGPTGVERPPMYKLDHWVDRVVRRNLRTGAEEAVAEIRETHPDHITLMDSSHTLAPIVASDPYVYFLAAPNYTGFNWDAVSPNGGCSLVRVDTRKKGDMTVYPKNTFGNGEGRIDRMFVWQNRFVFAMHGFERYLGEYKLTVFDTVLEKKVDMTSITKFLQSAQKDIGPLEIQDIALLRDTFYLVVKPKNGPEAFKVGKKPFALVISLKDIPEFGGPVPVAEPAPAAPAPARAAVPAVREAARQSAVRFHFVPGDL